MTTVSFYTLGCKLNQVETEALAESFKGDGFSIIPFSEQADLVIINTCTVTSKSEQKARRVIRKICRENPHAVVLATGCYAEMAEKAVAELGERVFAVTLARKPYLMDLPHYLLGHSEGNQSRLDQIRTFFSQLDDSMDRSFDFAARDFSFHSRAFLKIQDGCDNQCSYCRVTLARGDSRSLDSREVVRRVQLLENEGLREVVFTGVNIDSYSCNGLDLTGLTKSVLEQTEHIRIRLSSLNPDFINEDFARLAADPRLCGHFHIAVQSGSDGVLDRMKRLYPAEKILESVQLLRNYGDNPFLAADVITGFPGETETEFQETYTLLQKTGFHFLHIFPFSPRPGTEALDMKNQIPERISRERAALLKELSSGALTEYRRSWDGREVQVVVESLEPLSGISGNYLKGRINTDKQLKQGQMIRVKVQYDISEGVVFNF